MHRWSLHHHRQQELTVQEAVGYLSSSFNSKIAIPCSSTSELTSGVDHEAEARARPRLGCPSCMAIWGVVSHFWLPGDGLECAVGRLRVRALDDPRRYPSLPRHGMRIAVKIYWHMRSWQEDGLF
jgi:hypothetical protein